MESSQPLWEEGYDYHFVAPGPSDEQKCLICHLVVRDAYQVTCCGRMFCKGCINKCKQQDNLCPHCRQKSFSKNSFKDMRGDREIKSLMVLCDHRKEGCTWSGELRDVEEHMDYVCSYTIVDCPQGCGQRIIRQQTESHTVNECPLRQYACPLCEEEGFEHFITGDHQGQCPKAEVPCPNEGCTVRMERQDSAQHEKVCPKQLVKCPFASFGCSFHDCLELLPQHTEKEVQSHMEKIAQRMEKQSDKIENVEKIANESKRLAEDRFSTIIVKLTGYESYKQKNKVWYSNGFYTGPRGYRVRLMVYPNGCGNGESTYVSVFVCLMPGEHDDNLQFPLRGSYTITLLNQLQDDFHHTSTITFTGNETKWLNRQYKTHTGGYGSCKFINHTQLYGDPQYLMNDSLYFKIEASLPSNTKPWLAA